MFGTDFNRAARAAADSVKHKSDDHGADGTTPSDQVMQKQDRRPDEVLMRFQQGQGGSRHGCIFG